MGEFFPISLSPLPYNAASSGDYFPLEKHEVNALGGYWRAEAASVPPAAASTPPDSIEEAEEQVCGETFTCSKSNRPFKIGRLEFQFYKANAAPLPDTSWQNRHRARLRRRNPRELWTRSCSGCGTELLSSFPRSHPSPIVCESCWLAER